MFKLKRFVSIISCTFLMIIVFISNVFAAPPTVAISVTPANQGTTYPIYAYCDTTFSGIVFSNSTSQSMTCPATVQNLVFYSQSGSAPNYQYASCSVNLNGQSVTPTGCGTVVNSTTVNLAPTNLFKTGASLPGVMLSLQADSALSAVGTTTVQNCAVGKFALNSNAQPCFPLPVSIPITLQLSNSLSKSLSCVLKINSDGTINMNDSTCCATQQNNKITVYTLGSFSLNAEKAVVDTQVSGCNSALKLTQHPTSCLALPLSAPMTFTFANADYDSCVVALNQDGSMNSKSTCQMTPSLLPNGEDLLTLDGFSTICVDGNKSGVGTQVNNGGNNYNEYARYGDYLSAQMKSLRKFDYGMFIVHMQAANGPTCSTFWLYSDAPAPAPALPIVKLWRWNEFDIEFVPYTQATQDAYVYYNGSNQISKHTYCGTRIFLDQMSSGAFPSNQNAPFIVWTQNHFMHDDAVFSDMQRFYNRWMVSQINSATQLPISAFNFLGAQQSTGPLHMIGGTAVFGSKLSGQPGWPQASQWKYPLTAVNQTPQQIQAGAYGVTPSGPLNMVTLDWWRTPVGQESRHVLLHNKKYTYKYIRHDDVGNGYYAPATLNNETYVFPGENDGSSFDPYNNFHTYTIVWTPTRVSYYIDAPNNGKDFTSAQPVLVYDVLEYPSIKESGTQAPQGAVTWADTNLQDKLGEVSMNLANYVAFTAATNGKNDDKKTKKAGPGWSGAPPGSSFKSATAYFRSVKYYKLQSGKPGTQPSDFASSLTWGLDFSDGSWTANNFPSKITRYFGILYAQDFTNAGGSKSDPLLDSKSPLAVNFVSQASDGLPAMALTVTPSTATPTRNFFVLTTNMNTGKPVSTSNPFMYVTFTSSNAGAVPIGVSGVSTPLAFYGPPAPTSTNPGTISCTSPYTQKTYLCSAITGTVHLFMSHSAPASFSKKPTAPSATATVTLLTDPNGNSWWAVGSDPHGILLPPPKNDPNTTDAPILIVVQPCTLHASKCSMY